jgi:hypothetical protein
LAAWPRRIARASVRTARLETDAKALFRAQIHARTEARKLVLSLRATVGALVPSVSRAMHVRTSRRVRIRAPIMVSRSVLLQRKAARAIARSVSRARHAVSRVRVGLARMAGPPSALLLKATVGAPARLGSRARSARRQKTARSHATTAAS